jgi:hypothetical protein
MNQRFTYVGDTVIEFVVDGENLTVNVLPNLLPPESVDTPAAPAYLPAPDPAPVAAPLPEPILCAVEAPTKKKRTLWGVIRAGWFILFTVAGEALTYGLNNLTTLNLPPGTATAVGAVGYGMKKALWPDTTL